MASTINLRSLLANLLILVLITLTSASSFVIDLSSRNSDIQEILVSESRVFPGDAVAVFSLINDGQVRQSILFIEDVDFGGNCTDFAVKDSNSLIAVNKIDFERRTSYRLRVHYSSYSSIQSKEITLKIVDSNDEQPVILSQSQTSVSRETAIGTQVYEFRVRDLDAQDNALSNGLTYSFASQDHEEYFWLDGKTGVIRLRKSLTSFNESEVRLPILVSDFDMNHVTPFDLVIKLTDESSSNEKSSISFGNSCPMTLKVNEDTIPLLTLTRFLIRNSLETVSFSMQEDTLPFAVDSSTGVLSLQRNLDRETTAQYDMVIRATSATSTADCSVRIVVTDSNDNRPVFQKNLYSVLIDIDLHSIQDRQRIRHVTRVVASDADEQDEVTFALNATQTSDSALFSIINSTSGDIFVDIALLVDSNRTSFEFLVFALDSKSSFTGYNDTLGISNTTVSVTVVFSSEQEESSSPRFAHYPLVIEVEGSRSDFRSGSVIGRIDLLSLGSLSASSVRFQFLDHDHGKYYSNKVGCADFLDIDSSTGSLVVTKNSIPVNFCQSFLQVSSSGSSPASKKSSTTLLQVFFMKGLSSEQKSRKVSPALDLDVEVKESAQKDSLVLDIESHAHMPVLAKRSFSFVYSDNSNKFYLQEKHLLLNGTLDREMTKEFSIVVAALDESDPFDRPVFFSIRIRVLDVKDSMPLFTQDVYHALLKESSPRGSFVAVISAIDPDLGIVSSNRLLRYSIESGDEEDRAFVIDASTGVVKTANSLLDREIRISYSLRVCASSPETGSPVNGGSFKSCVLLEIKVGDEDDNWPVLPQRLKMTLPEGTEVGSSFGTIAANDVDSWPRLRYSMVSEKESPFFVESLSGRLLLTRRLTDEEEAEGIFKLKVQAQDSKHSVASDLEVRVTSSHADAPPRVSRVFDFIDLTRKILMLKSPEVEVARISFKEKENIRRLLFKVDSSFSDENYSILKVDSKTGVVKMDITRLRLNISSSARIMKLQVDVSFASRPSRKTRVLLVFFLPRNASSLLHTGSSLISQECHWQDQDYCLVGPLPLPVAAAPFYIRNDGQEHDWLLIQNQVLFYPRRQGIGAKRKSRVDLVSKEVSDYSLTVVLKRDDLSGQEDLFEDNEDSLFKNNNNQLLTINRMSDVNSSSSTTTLILSLILFLVSTLVFMSGFLVWKFVFKNNFLSINANNSNDCGSEGRSVILAREHLYNSTCSKNSMISSRRGFENESCSRLSDFDQNYSVIPPSLGHHGHHHSCYSQMTDVSSLSIRAPSVVDQEDEDDEVRMIIEQSSATANQDVQEVNDIASYFERLGVNYEVDEETAAPFNVEEESDSSGEGVQSLKHYHTASSVKSLNLRASSTHGLKNRSSKNRSRRRNNSSFKNSNSFFEEELKDTYSWSFPYPTTNQKDSCRGSSQWTPRVTDISTEVLDLIQRQLAIRSQGNIASNQTDAQETYSTPELQSQEEKRIRETTQESVAEFLPRNSLRKPSSSSAFSPVLSPSSFSKVIFNE